MEIIVIILFFIIVHSITAYYLLTDHVYIGEAYSVGRVSVDGLVIVLMLLSLVIGYIIIYRKYVKSDKYLLRRKYVVEINAKRLDWFYTIDLAFNLFLFFRYGVGSAVGAGTSNLTFLTSIFSARTLFPFYYVIRREKKLHYIFNILLYASLRLLQGWSSFLLTIAIIEVYFFFKGKGITGITTKKIILSLITPIGLVVGAGWFYSLIYPLKNYIRFDQVVFQPLSLKDGITAVIDRLSFFSQAIASIQTAGLTKTIYLNDSVTLGEIKGMLRPIVPGALMDKSFSTLPLCIKQSFVSYRASGTSLNVGIYSYLYNLAYSDLLSFLVFIIIIALLIYIFKRIIFAIQIEGQHNRIIYFLFMINILHITALEPVFSYDYIPILLMAPFLFILRIYSVRHSEYYAY